MNSLIIESSRQQTEGIVAGGLDTGSTNAVWTTHLKQAVQLNVGDRVSVPNASINAVGNQANTIEITGMKDNSTGTVDNAVTMKIQSFKSLDGQNYDLAPIPRKATEEGTPPVLTVPGVANYINSAVSHQHVGAKATRMNWKNRVTDVNFPNDASFTDLTGFTLLDEMEFYDSSVSITLDPGYLTPITICNAFNQQLQKTIDLRKIKTTEELVNTPLGTIISNYLETPTFTAVPAVPMTQIVRGNINVNGYEYSGYLNQPDQTSINTVNSKGVEQPFDNTLDYQVGAGENNTGGVYSSKFANSGIWSRGATGVGSSKKFLQGGVRNGVYSNSDFLNNLIPTGYVEGEYKYLNDPFVVNPEFIIAGRNLYNYINENPLFVDGSADGWLSLETQVGDGGVSAPNALEPSLVSNQYLLTNMLWDNFAVDTSLKTFMKSWLDSQFKTFLPEDQHFASECMIDEERREPNRKFFHVSQGADGTRYAGGWVGPDYNRNDSGLLVPAYITQQVTDFLYSAKDDAPIVYSVVNETSKGSGSVVNNTPAYGVFYSLVASNGKRYVAVKIPPNFPVANQFAKDGDFGTIYIGKNFGFAPQFVAPGNTTIVLNNGHPYQVDVAGDKVEAGIGSSALLNPFSKWLADGVVGAQARPKLALEVMQEPAKYIGKYIDLCMIGAINPTLQFDSDNGKFFWSDLHTPTMIRNGFGAGDTNKGETNQSGTIPNLNTGSEDTQRDLHDIPRPYGSFGNNQINNLAGTAIWTTHMVNNENNMGLNLDCFDAFSFDTVPGYLYDSQSGIFISDWGFIKSKFQGSIYFKLGFSYENLNNESQLHGRNVKAHTKRKATSGLVSNPPTTGCDIEGKTGLQLSTGRFNIPIYSLCLPRMCSSAIYGAIPTGEYNSTFQMGHPNLTATSTQLIGYNLPVKSETSFFTICSTLGEGSITYLGGRGGGMMLPVISVISKYYSGSDYFFGTDPNMSFTITKPTIISSIQTEIRTASGTLANNINGRSSVIYKIDRVAPPPVQVPAESGGETTQRETAPSDNSHVENTLQDLVKFSKKEMKDNIKMDERVDQEIAEQAHENRIIARGQEIEKEIMERRPREFTQEALENAPNIFASLENFQADAQLRADLRRGGGRPLEPRLTEREQEELPESEEALRALENQGEEPLVREKDEDLNKGGGAGGGAGGGGGGGAVGGGRLGSGPTEEEKRVMKQIKAEKLRIRLRGDYFKKLQREGKEPTEGDIRQFKSMEQEVARLEGGGASRTQKGNIGDPERYSEPTDIHGRGLKPNPQRRPEPEPE